MVSGLKSNKHESFGGKFVHYDFFPSEVTVCLISCWTLFKSAEFFFFLATLPSQKIVKEIAYIPTSFQAPFKSAIFIY